MPAKRSQQHAVLLDLEEKGEVVFYAAPRFHRIEEFVYCYRLQEMICGSAFIRPSWIGQLPDRAAHHVAFEPFAMCDWRISKPRAVEPILSGDGFIEAIGSASEKTQSVERPISDRIVAALENDLSAINDRRGTEKEEHGIADDPKRNPILLSQLAHRHFGVSVLFVSKRVKERET